MKSQTKLLILFFLFGLSVGFMIAGAISKVEFDRQMNINMQAIDNYKKESCNIKVPFIVNSSLMKAVS